MIGPLTDARLLHKQVLLLHILTNIPAMRLQRIMVFLSKTTRELWMHKMNGIITHPPKRYACIVQALPVTFRYLLYQVWLLITALITLLLTISHLQAHRKMPFTFQEEVQIIVMFKTVPFLIAVKMEFYLPTAAILILLIM